MEKIDILLWIVGGGFTLLCALMSFMWSSINGRVDRVETSLNTKIDHVEKILTGRMDKLDERIDKLDEKLTDVDRRLCRIEGSLAARDYCVLKDDHRHKKAE